MVHFTTLIFSFLLTCLKAMRPGGVKALAAENLALRQQLLVASRGRKRATELTFSDRLSFALTFKPDIRV
ncbi:hypothetical protein [Legionella sp. W05-934-2]|uniref:hypothetical protein n=1 Tax=Legionella sp. W05-934-2 TaxID=1198649 RepID=UPI003462070B